MLHPPGTRLGPYEILSAVGAGGMGDVYKARDTRLERTVAVKVAKERFEERFRNEALTVAALNHAHIAALFDVGPDYLVMEYVEGKALRGPLPVADVLRLGGEIADALEHAHRHGVVHRDLKPSNILLTKSGVKILDFGLARRRPSAPAEESRPTLTEEGAVLGTPRYMAPEQIDGKPADERTDIFAFGLVLYEMLTGQHAFEAKSAASVMAGILEREPVPISALKPLTPPALEQVVLTCLAKDPAERWQSVRELKHALVWASRSGPVGRRGGRTAWTAAVVAAALAGIAIGFTTIRRGTEPTRALPVRFEVALPEKAMVRWTEPLAVSPDGRQIAFSLLFPGQMPQLFLRPLDSITVTPVPGGERGALPFWSPDGRQIGFLSVPGAIKKVDLSGGPVQTVCKLGTLVGATWSREDVIVFSDSGRLFRVPARGGEPEPLGTLAEGETARAWPQFLPDGRRYLYLSIAARLEDRGIYVGSLDSDLRKRIVATGQNAAYSSSGHLLFIKDDALMAQPFDAQRLELSGEAFVVLDQVARLTGIPGLAQFSASTNGVLAWRTGSPAEPRQLTWFDRSGKRLGTLGEPAIYYRPVLSPDERRVAICRGESATNHDIWVIDAAGGAGRRLTFDPHNDCGPIWSPDGSRIAFRSDRRGVEEIYRKRADGSGDDELLLASQDFTLNATDWSADGRFLAYDSPRPRNLRDLFLLPLASAGEPKPIPYLATEDVEDSGQIAPNGLWMAYRSTLHGRFEVYVRDIAPRGEPGPGRWQISSGGGWAPRWRRDGKELLYATGTGIMAAEVNSDRPTFEARPPRKLFDSALVEEPGTAFEVTRDGQRLLMLVPVRPREPIRVRVNWLP